MGAVAGTHKFSAALLGFSEKDFRIRFHAYVSGDPSVRVEGSVPPYAAAKAIHAEYPLSEILNASAAALRTIPSEVKRKTALRHFFIHFAHRHGWRQPSLLGEICRISRQGIHKALQKSTPSGLSAGDLCLGDARLRRIELLGEFDQT